MRVVFDVGSNNGDNTKHFLEEEDTYLFAFEPIAPLYQDLKEKYGSHPRYRVHNVAVSDVEGTYAFHLGGPICPDEPFLHQRGASNWGCSSLYDFASTVTEEWKGRDDFKAFATVNVPVIRLDKFVEEHGIQSIDYLHVDAQGADLRVMKGLGAYLHIVKNGVLEAPINEKKKLYAESHTADEAILFLLNNGFKITDIEKNDTEGNEINIYFKRA